jgi:hypothetical protein
MIPAKPLDVNTWLAEDRPSHGRHDADIQTSTIVRKEAIRAIALTLFLETLAEHCGADLLRLKGTPLRVLLNDPRNLGGASQKRLSRLP